MLALWSVIIPPGVYAKRKLSRHKEHALDAVQPPQYQSNTICREQESMWQTRPQQSRYTESWGGVGHHFMSNQNRKSHQLLAFSHNELKKKKVFLKMQKLLRKPGQVFVVLSLNIYKHGGDAGDLMRQMRSNSCSRNRKKLLLF